MMGGGVFYASPALKDFFIGLCGTTDMGTLVMNIIKTVQNPLLTLGTHAQRGLRYLVCVSIYFCVCVCLRLFQRYGQQSGW